MKLVLNCYSTYADREHHLVVFDVTPGVQRDLRAAQDALISLKSGGLDALNSLELCGYYDLRTLLQVDKNAEGGFEPDPPDGPTLYKEFRKNVLEPGDKLRLIDLARSISLFVMPHGIYAEWRGQEAEYGPDETYYSENFTLADLRG